MPLPQELQQAVEDVIKPNSEPSVAHRPDVAARVCVALECWLHGSVTTEQAIGVLRALPARRR